MSAGKAVGAMIVIAVVLIVAYSAAMYKPTSPVPPLPATCSNGAINPPACNQYPACSNGAVNPPTCTAYSTTTSLSCNLDIVTVNFTYAACQVKVATTLAAAPTGSVSLSCSPTRPDGSCEATFAHDTCSSLFQARCSFNVQANEMSLVVYAKYHGDTYHQNSTSNGFTFMVYPPPTHFVAVSGRVTSFEGLRASQIKFTDSQTGEAHLQAIGMDGNYTIALTNFRSYTVQVSQYAFICGGGFLNLQSNNGTWTANWDCSAG